VLRAWTEEKLVYFMQKRNQRIRRQTKSRPATEPANPLVGGRFVSEKEFFSTPGMGTINRELAGGIKLKRIELKG
jgi:hypothetical protein